MNNIRDLENMLLKALNDQNFLIERKKRLLEIRAICFREGLLEDVSLIDSAVSRINSEIAMIAYRTLV